MAASRGFFFSTQGRRSGRARGSLQVGPEPVDDAGNEGQQLNYESRRLLRSSARCIFHQVDCRCQAYSTGQKHGDACHDNCIYQERGRHRTPGLRGPNVAERRSLRPECCMLGHDWTSNTAMMPRNIAKKIMTRGPEHPAENSIAAIARAFGLRIRRMRPSIVFAVSSFIALAYCGRQAWAKDSHRASPLSSAVPRGGPAQPDLP